MAGLDATGLTVKRLADVRADIEARLKAELGADVNVSPDSVLGHIIGVTSAELADAWELLGALYDGSSPNQAQGVQLDNLAAVVGVTRQAATKATGTITCSGTAGTTIPAGKEVRNSDTDETFLLSETVEIGAGGTVEASIVAEEAGERSVLGVDEIVTPVSGWTGVSNPTVTENGKDAESDAALRIRRQQSLQIVGAAADNAIRARVLEIEGVTACSVRSNRSLTTDGDGIPPKAFRVVVWPSGLGSEVEEAITEAIWEAMPAGVEPDGSEEFTVEDSQGYSQTVRWSYATAVDLYIEATISTDGNYPSDGDTQVADAIAAVFNGLTEDEVVTAQEQALHQVAGEGLSVGDDVTTLKLSCAVATVPGVVSASFKLDTANPPVNTGDWSIATGEIARLVDDATWPKVVVS